MHLGYVDFLANHIPPHFVLIVVVLVLMEELAFPGCFVAARLGGVVEAEQTERDGTVQWNDCLIAIATPSHTYQDVTSLDDLSPALVAEIEHFFISYNDAKGKTFRPLGRGGPDHARRLVDKGAERHAAAWRVCKTG